MLVLEHSSRMSLHTRIISFILFPRNAMEKQANENFLRPENQSTTVCQCGAIEKLQQVMLINRVWKQDYDVLNEKHVDSEKVVQELKAQTEKLTHENNRLHQLVLQNSSNKLMDIDLAKNEGLLMKGDEIAALRKQLEIYREDYSHLLTLMENMKKELEKSNKTVEKAERDNRLAAVRYEELKNEKENILKQLQELVRPKTRVERFLEPAIPPNCGKDVFDTLTRQTKCDLIEQNVENKEEKVL